VDSSPCGGQVLPAALGPHDRSVAADACSLLNRQLGQGMYSPEGLLRDAADPTAGVWVARTAAPAGVAVARLLIPADAAYYARFGAEATALFAGAVGSFEAVAIDPACRRQGIAARLTRTSLDWMRHQGCDAAVTISWLSGRLDSSLPLFRHLGFREGQTVQRFYEQESLEQGWSCPVCGRPCRCGATFFWLPLAPAA
jgi:GNAT superfamily N-acetyltransferase